MSKSFRSERRAGAKSTTAGTRFVAEPLNLHKDVSQNQYVAQKRREATESAADIVSIIQTVSAGQPPNNDQLGFLLDRSRNVLKEERNNPNLDTKAKNMVSHLEDLVNSIETLIANKNANEDFQRFMVYLFKSVQDLGQKGQRGDLTPRVDRFKVESLFDDIRRVSILVVRDREFRMTFTRFLGILERLFTSKVDEVTREKVTKEKGTEELGGGEVSDSPYRESSTTGASAASQQRLEYGGGSSRARVSVFDTMDPKEKIKDEVGRKTKSKSVESKALKETTSELRSSMHKILLSMTEKREFQMGVRSIFSIIENLQNDIGETGFTSGSVLTNNMRQTMSTGKTIADSFMTTDSLDNLIEHIRHLIVSVRKDQHLRRYFKDLRLFVERAMTDKSYLESKDYDRTIDHLIREGRRIANDYYDLNIRSIWREGQNTINDLKQDSDLMAVNNSLTNLFNDCFQMDRRGNYKLDTRTLFQLREVVLPLITQQFAYLPIPRISSRSRKLDWDVDGIILNGFEGLPDDVEIFTRLRSSNKILSEYQKQLVRDITVKDKHHRTTTSRLREDAAARADPHEFTNRLNGDVELLFSNIKADIKDVRFWFHRKVFPKIKDEGLANVSLPGKGISIRIRLNMDNRDIEHAFFTGGSVKVRVSKLKIHLRSTKRDGFYNFMTKVFSRVIARQIESAIAVKISEVMSRVIEIMNRTAREAPIRMNIWKSSGKSLVSNLTQRLTTS